MNTHFDDLVKHFGSQQATAEALGVKQGTVSGWVRGLHGCTAEVAIKAEIATKGLIKARDLRPSLPQRAA
ncbi:Cro/CI family transcriptional regulator [Pseudomonas sp.]|uniref:transcriptional regulator n=1 Tax=Pseudomonas sp. TaxID=306 RepID=UPI0028AFC105|nr:Cro/CI family transcriptional regulator [Pseudomonas sp.]